MAPKMLYKASYYGSSLCKVERRRSIGHIQLNSKLASVYNQQIHFLHLKNDVFIKRPCFTEAFPPFLSFGEKYFIKFRNDIQFSFYSKAPNSIPNTRGQPLHLNSPAFLLLCIISQLGSISLLQITIVFAIFSSCLYVFSFYFFNILLQF